MTSSLFANDGTEFNVPAHLIYNLARYDWFRDKNGIVTLLTIEGNPRIWSFTLQNLISLNEFPEVDLKAHFHPIEHSRKNLLQAIKNHKDNMVCCEKYMAIWNLYSNPKSKKVN